MIIALILGQATPLKPPSDTAQYKTCVQANVVKFERAKESASDTVNAATAACEAMRIKFRSELLRQRPEGSVLTPSVYRDLAYKLWDKAEEIERRDALVKVLEIRSRPKKVR